jgi:hypothetical protein
LLVRRVHWLRARSQKLRWEEEVMLVCYEMQWTVRYFLYNKEVWEERRNPQCPGPASYAARKAAMWFALATDADRTFAQVNKLYNRQFN